MDALSHVLPPGDQNSVKKLEGKVQTPYVLISLIRLSVEFKLAESGTLLRLFFPGAATISIDTPPRFVKRPSIQ